MSLLKYSLAFTLAVLIVPLLASIGCKPAGQEPQVETVQETSAPEVTAPQETAAEAPAKMPPVEVPVNDPATTPAPIVDQPQVAEEASAGDIQHLVGAEAFQTFIQSADITVVDFTATWCGPCGRLAPHFEKMAATYKEQGVRFAKVDVDENKELCGVLGVNSIPDVRVFVNGQEAKRTIGFNPMEIFTNIENTVGAQSGN